jgi:hypothetical protein
LLLSSPFFLLVTTNFTRTLCRGSKCRLGYLLFIDVTSWRPSWQDLLVARILQRLGGGSVGGDSGDYKSRIVFQTPESAHDAVHIMQMGHVMLDPFPVTGEQGQKLLVALYVNCCYTVLCSSQHLR